ncbi:MAG: nucleoside hydrolase [Anaerolineales bacterium]|jgi:uridine nucleosidase
MRKKVIVDTDPGVDDAMMILAALRSPELEVIGVTSVFGNASGYATAQNALRLVELEGNDNIPVARGSDRGLVVEAQMLGTMVHGEDGMGNTNPPLPKGKWLDISAAQFIAQKVLENPRQVTLLAVGPLTNVALALRLEPRIVELVEQVVIMGGSIGAGGNISPVAEANIFHDPHAAEIVFSAGLPLVMVGLDVTLKVIQTRQYLDKIKAANNPAGHLLRSILPCYQRYHDQAYGMGGDIHTHDPSALAYVLDPELFKVEEVPVYVETSGYGFGQTIADRRRQLGQRPPVSVCVEVDAPGVLALIEERLTR